MAENKLRNALRQLWHRNEEQRWLYGQLGRRKGGTTELSVEGRKGYVYVRVRSQETGAQTSAVARNDAGVPLSPNLAVRLRTEGTTLVIDSIDRKEVLSNIAAPTPSGVAIHTHDERYVELPHTLTNHDDVDLVAVAAGEVLAHNGTNWVNTDNIPVTVAATINASDGKSTPVDNDELGLVDSADGFSLKTLTWNNVKVTLKAYFDTLYGQLAAANIWTQNNTIASTATTGNALNVTRDLAAASTDAPVVSFVQDNTGDDQATLRVQQDGTGDILASYDGASLVFRIKDGGGVSVTQTGVSGNALAILRDLAAASTDAPVVSIVQDNTGDDQVALRVQQDGTGNIAELYSGATLVWSVSPAGVLKLDGNLVLSASGTQDYRFTDDTGDALVLEGLGTGKNVDIRVNAFDADGTDNVIMSFWGLGKTGATGNRERLIFGYIGADLRFQFRSEAAGTGTTRPIAIFTGSNTNQLIVAANGRVGVNSATPAGQLGVIQSSATGAIPVLKLTQSDLSEEMIRFETTVGAGNPVNTSAAGSRYGRVRVHIEGVGEKWLELYNT